MLCTSPTQVDTAYERAWGWLKAVVFSIASALTVSAIEFHSDWSLWDNCTVVWREVVELAGWLVRLSAAAGSAMVGGLVFARELYHYWVPRRVGIYGPSMVGKTTLDKYLTTPGEMEDILSKTGHRTRKYSASICCPVLRRKRYGGKVSDVLFIRRTWVAKNATGIFGLTTW